MIVFIVTGRLGENLVYYKTLPVAAIDKINHVFVFTTHKCRPVPKVTYINLPQWINNVRPGILGKLIRQVYEPFQILLYAIKYRPYLINGVYTLPKGLYSLIVSEMTGSRCVVSVIGGKGEMDTMMRPVLFWRKVKWWLVRRADAITTKGEHDNQYFYSKGLNPSKVFTFNGCIDLERFRDGNLKRDIDVIYVGSMYELKGPARTVEVLKRLANINPDLVTYMIGDGVDLEKTKQQAKNLGLANNIHFPGFVRDVENYYCRAKVLILMSYREGNPNCMLEAMACGCVPVVPNVGNIKHTIKSGVNGIMIDDCFDVESYATEIAKLLANSEYREGIAKRGKETVKEKYSIKIQSIDFEKVIKYLEN